MTRSTFKPFKALWLITVMAAVIALTAGPASARLHASGLPASGDPIVAACQTGALSISVPAAISGDPAEGMGKRAWNVVFRDIASTACSLRGWPRIVVRTAAGKTVPTTVSDVMYGNLAPVPDAQVILRPGQSAVVTAMSAATTPGCVNQWTLSLTLPGADRPVPIPEPAGAFGPCTGGQLRLSPFYAEQTLMRQVAAMKISAAPPPFSAITTAEPPACQSAALQAQVTAVVSKAGGSIIGLRLGNNGGTCVLPEGWPTVQVNEAGSASQVAKIFPDTAAVRAGRALLTTYDRGTAQKTALTLRAGESVSVALVAARETRACHRVTSLTIYSSGIAWGAGRAAHLTAPVSVCGSLRVLSFLPGQPGGTALTIAQGALAQTGTGSAWAAFGRSSSGFYYGTDSSAPEACGNGPYTEPVGTCANGTDGPYGAYIGEVGSFLNWQGCTTSGLNWVQANYNMATDNVVRYGMGLGAAAYWFAAGPGRDPHYNGTTSEAMLWGQQQAQQAISDLDGRVFDFRYIFMDIENNGVPPDEDGWNTAWNGPCGSHVRGQYIPANVDYATWQGFAQYIDAHSPYLAGVYSAGGDYYGSWTGIFGGETLTNAAEWTFTNEQSELSFPSGFSGPAASAEWFAGAPAACHLMWQWSGGNGVLNGYGDLDQAEAANDASPSCLALKAVTREGWMVARPAGVAGWTAQHARHAAAMLWQGGNPVARVYESIGSDFSLAMAPGWLNLGLWEGPGYEGEAEQACRRLVSTLASALPAGGVIVDVGNGLGTQDPLIAGTVRPRRLVAVNITEWQLRAGRDRLRRAAGAPVVGDAARLPLADHSVDGIISVEAAFHFRSRKAFFGECYRVLRPGGVVSISDVSVQRWPVLPGELLAGLTQLRLFGLRPTMAMTAGQIAAAARTAGLDRVEITRCGGRVIAPALRLTAERLKHTAAAPAGQRAAARLLLSQVELLWRRRIIDYLLVSAIRP